jgi:hypothetical protein
MTNKTTALLVGAALLLPLGSEVQAQDDECSLVCPANITVSNAPNQCGQVVNYGPPLISGDCGPVTVTCTPASGSFFPVGQTEITCEAGDGPTCNFHITVNDTQPPSITCPENISQKVSKVPWPVEYTSTASDNCPGVALSCEPPSGSSFPAGDTAVPCTATDASDNTATCDFQVSLTPPPPKPIPVLAPLGLGALLLSLTFFGTRLMRSRRRT